MVRADALGTGLPQPFHTNLHFPQLPPLPAIARSIEGNGGVCEMSGTHHQIETSDFWPSGPTVPPSPDMESYPNL